MSSKFTFRILCASMGLCLNGRNEIQLYYSITPQTFAPFAVPLCCFHKTLKTFT